MRIKVNLLLLLLITVFFVSVNPVVGKTEAPDFTLTDIYETRFSLSGYLGKVVLIEFFYIGCSSCKAEIPEFKQLCNEYSSDEFAIISVDVSPYDTDADLQNYVQENGIPCGEQWRVARDTAQLGSKYVTEGVPTLLIIDTEGSITFHQAGALGKSQLVSLIDPLRPGGENGEPNGHPNGDSNGDSDGDSDGAQPWISIELVGIIGVAVVCFLIIGIVVAGQALDWSKPAKKRGKDKR